MHTFRKTFTSPAKETWNFEFTRIVAKASEKYFITGSNDQQTVAFELRKQLNGWKIIPPAPGWILQLQEQITFEIESARIRGLI